MKKVRALADKWDRWAEDAREGEHPEAASYDNGAAEAFEVCASALRAALSTQEQGERPPFHAPKVVDQLCQMAEDAGGNGVAESEYLWAVADAIEHDDPDLLPTRRPQEQGAENVDGEELAEAVFYAGYDYAKDERLPGPITSWTHYRRNEGRKVVDDLATDPPREPKQGDRRCGWCGVPESRDPDGTCSKGGDPTTGEEINGPHEWCDPPRDNRKPVAFIGVVDGKMTSVDKVGPTPSDGVYGLYREASFDPPRDEPDGEAEDAALLRDIRRLLVDAVHKTGHEDLGIRITLTGLLQRIDDALLFPRRTDSEGREPEDEELLRRLRHYENEYMRKAGYLERSARREAQEMADLLNDTIDRIRRIGTPPTEDLSPLERLRRVTEALGFDPTNHHNAAKCPYCTPPTEDGEALFRKVFHAWMSGFEKGVEQHPEPAHLAKRHAELAGGTPPSPEGESER